MKRIVISAMLIMFVVQVGKGQTLKTYSGLYEDGKAAYTYYEDENGERVKHGKYTYNRRDAIATYNVTGNYKDNRKDGKWTYKETANGNKVNITRMLVIDYANGAMEGGIDFSIAGNNGSTYTKHYQMSHNRVIGAISEKDKIATSLPEAYALTGQFDNEGFPDGIWTQNYEKNGSHFIDTEKYVHGILVARQTKNESTGKIERSKFYIDPQKFVAAYSPGQDSVIVDGFICKLETRFAEDEKKYYLAKKPFFYSGRLGKYYAFASEEERDWQRLPDIIGASIRGFAIGSKAEKGYGSEQDTYQGIPYKEIAIVGEIEKEINESPNEGMIYDMVEQMPQFPGGTEKLNEYLSTHVQYPEEAQEKGIQGRVVVGFVVNRDGSISDAKVARSVDPSLDNEALRVINSMPCWIPGQVGGKNVRVRYTLPLSFRLQ